LYAEPVRCVIARSGHAAVRNKQKPLEGSIVIIF
jgi:hypothetical protein